MARKCQYRPFGAVVGTAGGRHLPIVAWLPPGPDASCYRLAAPCGVSTALTISLMRLAEGWIPPLVIPAAECRLMREGEASDACGEGCRRPGCRRALRRSRRLRSARSGLWHWRAEDNGIYNVAGSIRVRLCLCCRGAAPSHRRVRLRAGRYRGRRGRRRIGWRCQRKLVGTVLRVCQNNHTRVIRRRYPKAEPRGGRGD